MNRPTTAATVSRVRAAPKQPTRTVGPWQLVRLLGQGAWTEVYQARPASGASAETADYVVKVLQRSCQHDPLAIQVLQREAFVARQVRHPHLCSILSAHTDRAPRFVVLPYIDGISAASALQVLERLIAPRALWIVRQTAEGLQALHQIGWLHGDVKPANIIVSANGHATLSDLGLAHPLDAPRPSEQALTGSMAYACPEMFNPNVPFSAGSDVYSLGVTLYELLTGSRPFTDEDPTDLAAAHLVRPAPDPRAIVPQLPTRVARLLRQMLAKNPLRRPAVPELIERLVDLEVATFSERWSVL